MSIWTSETARIFRLNEEKLCRFYLATGSTYNKFDNSLIPFGQIQHVTPSLWQFLSDLLKFSCLLIFFCLWSSVAWLCFLLLHSELFFWAVNWCSISMLSCSLAFHIVYLFFGCWILNDPICLTPYLINKKKSPISYSFIIGPMNWMRMDFHISYSPSYSNKSTDYYYKYD